MTLEMGLGDERRRFDSQKDDGSDLNMSKRRNKLAWQAAICHRDRGGDARSAEPPISLEAGLRLFTRGDGDELIGVADLA